MQRLLEVFFRHPMRLLLILIFPPLISVAVAYFVVPRSYQATARLWSYERFGIITATGQPDTNAFATPAQTQTTALTEMLNSRSFVLSVVQNIDIVPTLHLSDYDLSSQQLRDDAVFAEISKNVVATPLDFSLYTITYKNRDPKVAQEVVASVINQFGIQGIAFTYGQAQRLLGVFQSQLLQAKNQASSALAAEQQYLANHPELSRPGFTPYNDPVYASLDAQRVQTQTSVQNLELSIASLNQQISVQGTTSGSFFKELDPPLLPVQSLSRSKQYLLVGGIGGGVGLLACVILLLIMVRRDRAIYTPRDIERLAALPVVMQLPRLPGKTVELLTERSA